MNLLEKIEEVKLNYKDLPKIKSSDGEFVIIAEKDKGGCYEEYKECIGVKEDGDLVWSYLSGCSCGRTNDNQKVTDITSKIFNIEKDDTIEEFYNNNKCEPYAGSYESY